MKEFLIEKWLPFDEISAESIRERAASSALPPLYYLHVWFARRPLLTSRAAVLLSLIQNKDEKKIWEILGLPVGKDVVGARVKIEKARATGNRIKKNPLTWPHAYKHTPSKNEIEWLHNQIKENNKIPTVLDPMAGGGSIPYEAMRLGLPVICNDLNPVAFICLKATVEYPAKFREKLLPAVKDFCDEVHEKAKKELDKFFPTTVGEKIMTHIWSRTIKCKSCGLVIPMAPNWWLAREGKKTDVAVKPTFSDNSDECSFEIIENPKDNDYDPDKGTDKRKEALCPRCNTLTPNDSVKKIAQGEGLGHQLFAVYTKNNQKRAKRKFRLPDMKEINVMNDVKKELNSKIRNKEIKNLMPSEDYFKGFSDRCYVYGFRKWTDFFNPRQLLTHITYVEKFLEVKKKWLNKKDKEFSKAVCVYGAIVFDKSINFNSVIGRWAPDRVLAKSVMDMQSFPFRTSYAEWNPLVEKGGFEWAQANVLDSLKKIIQYTSEKTNSCQVSCSDAASLKLDDKSIETIVVDPPYHDNVIYSEMSNFFYVWLKRLIGDLFPGYFDSELTNRIDEAVANESMYKDVEKPKNAANQHYSSKMKTFFTEMNRVLKDDGILTVMFMHKKSEAWSELTQALMDSGFTFRASWPVFTEPGQKFGKADKGVLKVMILLICRKRQKEKTGSWKEVQKEIRQEASNTVKQYSDKGILGMELLVSVYGPVLGKFADYQIIKDSYGKTIGPEYALDIVSEVVNEFNTAEVAGTDFSTQAYINLVKNFPGMTVEEDLARVTTVFGGKKNIDELSTKGGKGMLEKKAGKVTILVSKDRIAQGFVDTEKPETLVNLIDTIHACLYVYEQKGLGAVKDILSKTERDAADSGFISVLRVIGSFVNMSPHKKLAEEASIANNLLAALGHEPESVLKKGERISDWKEGERLDDY